MRNRIIRWTAWALLAAVLIAAPQISGRYYINVLVLTGIFALYAASYNLLLGYTGLLSFGHALFFGGGAYATAIALSHVQNLPLLPAVLIGGLAAIIFALITSPLLARVSGTAFVMLTLAFGQLMYVFCLKFRSITGGEDGIGGFPIPSFNIPKIISIDMSDPLHYYYFAMVIIAASLWILWFFTKTPLGSVMTGIRDNPKRVEYLGFKVAHTKAVVFIISGFFAGIAGALYALLQGLVSTDGVLTIYSSFMPIMMIFIGGLNSFFGAVYGSVIFTILDEVITAYTQHVELIIGIIFIMIVMYTPTGFAGLLAYIRRKLRSRYPFLEFLGKTS